MADSIKTYVCQKLNYDEITDEVLTAAAEFHGNHYGVWGPDAPEPLKPGASSLVRVHSPFTANSSLTGDRVKCSPERLKAELVPKDADVTYVHVTGDEIPVVHVFACRWSYNGSRVCWITQLVVHRNHREKGLAGMLLRHLRSNDDQIMGIMTPHPFACAAAVKAFGCTLFSPHFTSRKFKC